MTQSARMLAQTRNSIISQAPQLRLLFLRLKISKVDNHHHHASDLYHDNIPTTNSKSEGRWFSSSNALKQRGSAPKRRSNINVDPLPQFASSDGLRRGEGIHISNILGSFVLACSFLRFQ
ncbi:hypothetical protein ACMFMG_009482 [Clarireedia jacksonii]